MCVCVQTKETKFVRDEHIKKPDPGYHTVTGKVTPGPEPKPVQAYMVRAGEPRPECSLSTPTCNLPSMCASAFVFCLLSICVCVRARRSQVYDHEQSYPAYIVTYQRS